MKGGRLLPVVQEAMMFHDQIVYDDNYSGLALDTAEGDRVAGLLGDKKVIFMRNHGPMVVGTDISETYYSLYYLGQVAGCNSSPCKAASRWIPFPTTWPAR